MIVQPSIVGASWSAGGISKLDNDLDAMLTNDPSLRGAHFGVYAIDTASGNPLYSHSADDEIQPASTFKLVVGSAALEKLGPDFRFSTQAFARRATVNFLSDGDPTLDAAAIDEAAQAYRNYGHTDLVDLNVQDDGPGTSGYLPFLPYPNGWTWDDFGQEYAPVVSPLSFEENVVHVAVTPSEVISGWANVDSSEPVTFADRNAVCDPHAAQGPKIVSLIRTGPAGSEDTIDVARIDNGCPTLIGSIPKGTPTEDLTLSVDPELYFRAAVLQSMARAGVDVSNVGVPPTYRVRAYEQAIAEPGPSSERVWDHKSKPLAMLLGPRFWIPSDNLFGELLLRRLSDSPMALTTDNGIAYERTWLQSIGVDPATVTLADGCGMSQYDRITPRDLVAILQHDWNGPNRRLVLDSLPVGGARGTIEGIAGTDAAGRVFAKTGSMMHVRGLAGYLATLHHGAVTFAFQVDDWNGAYPALAALRARVLSRIIDD